MNVLIGQLKISLREKGVVVKSDWLDECTKYLIRNGSNPDKIKEFTEKVFDIYLDSDLQQIADPVLAPDIKNCENQIINGPYILQIIEILNIGSSLVEQDKNNAANEPPTSSNYEMKKRLCKICLSDGFQLVTGIEFAHLPGLAVNSLLGTKILVQNVELFKGVLLLTPQCVQVLGGEVERLVALQKNNIATDDSKSSSTHPSDGITNQTPRQMLHEVKIASSLQRNEIPLISPIQLHSIESPLLDETAATATVGLPKYYGQSGVDSHPLISIDDDPSFIYSDDNNNNQSVHNQSHSPEFDELAAVKFNSSSPVKYANNQNMEMDFDIFIPSPPSNFSKYHSINKPHPQPQNPSSNLKTIVDLSADDKEVHTLPKNTPPLLCKNVNSIKIILSDIQSSPKSHQQEQMGSWQLKLTAFAIKKFKAEGNDLIVHLDLIDSEGYIHLIRIASDLCEKVIGMTSENYQFKMKQLLSKSDQKTFKNSCCEKFASFQGVCTVQYDRHLIYSCQKKTNTESTSDAKINSSNCIYPLVVTSYFK